MLETVLCDLCGQNRPETLADIQAPLGSPERLRVVICLECGFIYFTPRLSIHTLKDLYGGPFYDVMEKPYRGDPPPEYLARARLSARERLAFIQKHVPLPGKRLLDVRCRLGQFMVEAAALGVLPRGLDELDTSANYCRSLGFAADVFPLEDPARSRLEGEFDVVRLNNVLAHSPSPSATLAAFAERLSPSGAMFIEEPDILLKKAGPFPMIPFHLWLPTNAALEALLAKVGLRIAAHRMRGSVIFAVAERGAPEHRFAPDSPQAVIAHFSDWRSRTPAELLDGFPDKQTRSRAAKRMAQADRARRRRPWWKWRNSASANDGP